MASCNVIRIQPVTSSTAAAGRIIFATATPGSGGPAAKARDPLRASSSEPGTRFVSGGTNELGKIMVLEYHRIGKPEQRFQRTPDNFRADLKRLHAGGFYPVNFSDLIDGLPHVPAGKKPIVLTFDDSDITQFRMLGNNIIDADSAVGILLNFQNQHPTEWPARATFFVLGNDTAEYVSIFGQPKWARSKLQFLVEMGMEVGSHTANHTDLSVATAERINWELAVSKRVIEEMAPGYTVRSLSVPYGGYPFSQEFLTEGEWGGFSYRYSGIAAAWGGPAVSPFDSTFEPYHVPRIEILSSSIDHWLTYFERNPHEYYVSDGDPSKITFPQAEVAAE